MEALSFQIGVGQGVGERDAALHNVVQWKDFSQRLQGKLQKAEFDFVEAATQREGFARVLARMKDELKRLDPNNPLLRDEVRHQIYNTGVADKFRDLGYDYDSIRGVFRKRG